MCRKFELDSVRWFLLPILCINLLTMTAACATPYQPNGFAGGFSQTQLDENVFQVVFEGNGYTSQERAADLALLRSAELTLELGYSYFIIVDASKQQKHGALVTGGQIHMYSKPSKTNTIVCYRAKPEINGLVYNVTHQRRPGDVLRVA